jgi:hypothetical protein
MAYNFNRHNGETLFEYRRRLRAHRAVPPNYQVCDNLLKAELQDRESDSEYQRETNAWHRIFCKGRKPQHYPVADALPYNAQEAVAYGYNDDHAETADVSLITTVTGKALGYKKGKSKNKSKGKSKNKSKGKTRRRS